MSDSPDTADLKKQLEAAIAAYKAALKNVSDFEGKLAVSRKSEADALSDDSADERATVRKISEAQGLQAVFSRRAEIARQKVPEAFAAIFPLAKTLAQDLTNRCFALADERAARHVELFRTRLDLETFHRQFLSALPAFPVDFESDLDKLVGCCADVLGARVCVPQLSFLTMRVMPPDLTFEKLQWDLETLEKAEAAYEAEAAKEYNFEKLAEVEVETSTCRSLNLCRDFFHPLFWANANP